MIDQFDWAHLTHAYGKATDIPGHLAALTSSDEKARADALTHLDSAVLHQGFPGEATAPVARVVGWLIATGAVDGDVLGELVEFLGAVASATYELREDSSFAPCIPELEASVVEAYHQIVRLLDSDSRSLRTRVAEAVVEQLRLPQLASERPSMAHRLRRWLTHENEDRHVRVRLLGELGEDVQEFLDDPDRAVRLRAALAPSSRHSARAVAILVDALADSLPAGVHRTEVVTAVIDRVDDFDRIAEPATAIAQQARWTGFHSDWGPLLTFAFREPYRPGTPLSPGQKSLLRALTHNDDLWDPRNGSIALLFEEAGLPRDREQCERILTEAPHES
ncbi:hypothetical protein [Microbispora sp. NPDC046933]|uniref:hypothetical protein n=1 Tax=Microbispora sp. NPDC046933 TaxID=3155618 RepID=UPI0033E32726